MMNYDCCVFSVLFHSRGSWFSDMIVSLFLVYDFLSGAWCFGHDDARRELGVFDVFMYSYRLQQGF